ncbi:glycosyltransferase family 4 protein [Niallia sp. 01092]|uniref:glycosyltransferase family 4 protein n=1 Tax=unclassified Niallia TaxID=2837522 RepID=UPI003FD1B928
MKKIAVIGPLPPPIHGESLAIQSIIESEKLNQEFIIKPINTNRKMIKNPGGFAIGKVMQDIAIILRILFINTDIGYISISQTKLGLLRDLVIIYLLNIKKVKIITHLHGNSLGITIENLSKFWKRIVKYVFKRINIGIVLGQSLSHNYQGLVQDLRVVQNGVSEEFLLNEQIEKAIELKSKKDFVQIVYLSNLIESKGFLLLAKSCVELIKEGLPIRLVLAGAIHNKDSYDELIELINKQNCKEEITYLGTVFGKEKQQLLLDSDLMVLPTKYKTEGQPLSIIEGMAAALPIISTKVGCIEDMINENGILLEDPTVDSLKKAIRSLVKDPEIRKDYSIESRRLYKKEYTLKKHINKMESIFNEM